MRVAVITEDARMYYLIVRTLKDHGIGFYSLRVGEKIPIDVEVVVTDERTAEKIDFPQKVIARDKNFIDELLAVLEGRAHFKQVFIAIDPGERPGVSVVADNRVLEVHRLKSPREIHLILDLLDRYPTAKIKIGHGAKRQRVLMLRALGQVLGYDYPVILVNEARTTPRVGNTESPGIQDIVASINIGLRKGREMKIRELLDVKEPTKKEVENIKRRSRELSGNITISTRLAREVAIGNLTIEEAIEIQKSLTKEKRDGQPS